MKILYIMCGPPGSGKTWFAKNTLLHSGVAYISRDDIRFALVEENKPYFSQEKMVFNIFIQHIKTALSNNTYHSIIADATHLNEASRKKLLKALNFSFKKTERNICIIPVYFTISLKKCQEYNSLRSGRARVPKKVVETMFNAFKIPNNDKEVEYDAILEVRV